MTDFLLYGGKGGVGKTTAAAATGLALAGAGRETLVVSTDPAHSLADAFEMELSGQPRQIREHLWVAEVDPATGQETFARLARTFAAELREVGIRLTDEDVEELFLAGVAPGGDEVAALDAIAEYSDENRWDCVVLDTAPTGHTLRLLELPRVLETAMEKSLKVRGQVRSLANSARQVMFGPYYYVTGREADERDEFADFRERMERVEALLVDPARTEFRVVTLPESLAIRETERLVERLRGFDVPVRTLVVNSVLEEIDASCDRCRARCDAQRERLAEIERRFPELEMLRLPELETEVAGMADLVRLAARFEH